MNKGSICINYSYFGGLSSNRTVSNASQGAHEFTLFLVFFQWLRANHVCELSVDEGRKKILTKMTMGVVANGRFLGGGFMPALKADISDGLLDIVILKNSGEISFY